MKNMRPFQIVVIAIFAFLAAGGLYFFATFKGFSGGEPLGQVIVWGTLSQSDMQVAIDDLRRTQQEFGKVTYIEQDAETFDAVLSDALASGTGPDLIVTDQEHLLEQRNKIAIVPSATLSERTFRDTYLPIAEIFMTSGGVYGIPFAVDPLVLYYNRPALATANVPTVPTTWEAIVGLAPRLTQKSDAGVIARSAIALGTYDNIPNARAILSLIILQSGSPLVENANGFLRSTLASGAPDAYTRSPGESAVSFYTQFADPAKIVYTWNRSIGDARQAFIAGDVAFYIGYASERKLITESNPNLDFDMAPIPQPETARTQTNYGLVYAFAVPRGSANVAGAQRTAAALAGKDQAVITATSLGMAPAVRAFLTPPQGDSYAAIYYPAALIARGWLSPSPGTTDRIFAAMINSIINGQQTVHGALTTAEQSFTAALQ